MNLPDWRISFYFILSLLLYGISVVTKINSPLLNHVFNAVLLLVFLVTCYVLENKEFRKFLH